MKNALMEKDAAKRASILHDAEKLLLTDMPVTPLLHLDNTFAVSDELDDVTVNYFGSIGFKDTSYDNYVPTEAPEEPETTTEAPTTTAAPSAE